MKKLLILITSAVLILFLIACSQDVVDKSKDIVDSNAIQDSKVLKDDVYLDKDIISLEDIEKVFKEENINLKMKELDKSDFAILQEKYPTDYYIDNDENHMLRIYVFASENERVKAGTEYDEKTATMDMTYRGIYEVKNVMIFLIAGDVSNEYYQRTSLIVEKIKAK